ncbi:MAG: hypothetical protein N4A49_10480 [Marinifilaceae bacterium]|nr:hypothetical protein [Marinifilaceae bacterium]
MKATRFKSLMKSVLIISLAIFAISCGDDYTDDYDKAKKEYDQLVKENSELLELNKKLKDNELKAVKESQNNLITNFITNTLQNINEDNDIVNTQYKNIFEDGKLHQTIVKKRIARFGLEYNNKPIEEKIYTHSYNENGIIIQSKYSNITIDYGWKNSKCISIILTEGNEKFYFEYNEEGEITSLKGNEVDIKYTYDENYNIIKIIDSSEKDIYTKEFEYLDNNKLSKYTWKVGDVVIYETNYSYENGVSTIDNKSYLRTGEFYEQSRFKFNANNRLLEYYEHQTHSSIIKRYIEIEYTDDKISKYTRRQENYTSDNKLKMRYHKLIDEITNFKIAMYPKYVNNRYDAYNDDFRKARFKTWSESPSGEINISGFNIYENQEARRDDYYHKTETITELNPDGTIKEKTIFSNWFTKPPYAPQKKETSIYENSKPKSKKVYSNSKNEEYLDWKEN